MDTDSNVAHTLVKNSSSEKRTTQKGQQETYDKEQEGKKRKKKRKKKKNKAKRSREKEKQRHDDENRTLA
jgi:hypothetical protein